MRRLMKSAALAAGVGAVIAAQLATPAAAKVSVTRSNSPVLAPGSTYAWAPVNAAAVAAPDPTIANSIVEARLRAAVDTALASKGYRKVSAPAGAELVVSYFVVLKQQDEAKLKTSPAMFCGWRGCLRTSSGNVEVERSSYTQGSLVLDLADRRSGELVWRAASGKRVDAGDVTQAKLNSLVKDMTKSLPST